MRNLRKIIFVLCAAGLNLVAVLPFMVSVEAQDHKKHDLTCALSADAVLDQLKEKEKPVLIDIRNPDLFDRIRIPESVNIPLYAVKTKHYLKKRRIVLIDEGYEYSRLETECKKLKETGFHAFILFGGLNAWAMAGGRMEGDLLALEGMKKVFSRQFHLEKDYENHLTLCVTRGKEDSSFCLASNAIRLRAFNEDSLRSAVLSNQIPGSGLQGKNAFRMIVIAGEDGAGYEKAEKIIKKMKMMNVYYLDGGFMAYRQYLERVSLSQQPKASRMKQQKKCGGCGT